MAQTHVAIATVKARAPLEIVQVLTHRPGPDEVLVKNQWVSTGPLELHQADGALLVKHPQVLGDSVSGTVLDVGSAVEKYFKPEDEIFGFAFLDEKQKSWQTVSTVPANMIGKRPANITPQQAAIIPTNLVTVLHTLTTDLHLSLPWPKPASYVPSTKDPILIWGASSSVGQYALQVLKYYGYSTLAIASARHHSLLLSLGATHCLDYTSPTTVEDIKSFYARGSPPTAAELVLDCIGSGQGSLTPISSVLSASPDHKATLAVMLPIILTHASSPSGPEYSMDPSAHASWPANTEVNGVRTHFYQQNEEFRERLQREIIPEMVAQGVVVPNRIRIVEGKDMLERAETALGLLRREEVRGEKLVWRIDD